MPYESIDYSYNCKPQLHADHSRVRPNANDPLRMNQYELNYAGFTISASAWLRIVKENSSLREQKGPLKA